jgi:allantoicase
MGFTKVTEIIKESPSFTSMTDLAAGKLGGKVLYATDDFCAEKENLLKPGRGIFITDKYTERGKWMDGWESRRKRIPGHDWAVIKLASLGKIHGVDIDTNHFLGNHPPDASIEAISLTEDISDEKWDELQWKGILPKSHLDAGSQNFFVINDRTPYTHIRLHIYPDGGVARLRVYGEVAKDWSEISPDEELDLAAAINGANAISCNDMFFSHMQNLIMPDKGENMGDGWETKRNRMPGNRDWVIIRLATRGIIDRVIIDTCHFKGNYPDSFSLEICDANDHDVLNEKVEWKPLLSQQKLSADKEHEFSSQLIPGIAGTHVRLNIFPDGGVSRMRLFGKKLSL